MKKHLYSKTIKTTVHEILCLDTTGIEFLSAFTGICMGIGMFLGLLEPIFWYKTKEFWAMIVTIAASLQLSSIVVHDARSINVLRIIMALIAAAGWLWLGLRQLERLAEPADLAVVFLGISNFHAFIYLSLSQHCKQYKIDSGSEWKK